MKVLVTGATGVLGRRVLPRLLDAGHEVVAAVRTPGRHPLPDVRETTVDLFDVDAVQTAVTGCDAVLHLATSIPAGTRARYRRSWTTNDRLRREATANLAVALGRAGGQRLVMQSVAFGYTDGGDALIDEATPLQPSAVLRSAYDGEHKVTDAVARGTLAAGVSLRLGVLYASEARSTQEALGIARRGLAPVVGDPGAFTSFVHADDAAAAFVAALTAPTGTYNVSGPPVRNKDLAETLGQALGKPPLRIVSRRTARLLAGPNASVFARSHRLDSSAFTAATGWAATATDTGAEWAALARRTTAEPTLANDR